MFKRFNAQNADGELYTALDFSGSNAFLYFAKDGDISILRKFIQLSWASTSEDGLSLTLNLNSSDHTISSTPDNIYLDENVAKISAMESFYGIGYSDYSKLFVITYTQLLNLELGRIPFQQYLNRYVFHKPDSKSYYSPVEDIFYDIEQARKYSGDNSASTLKKEKNDISEKSEILRKKIKDLENINLDNDIDVNIDEKINNLEKKLGDQKKQDEYVGRKEVLVEELKSINEKIKQYEVALNKVSKVDIDMVKYNNFMRLNVQRVENDLSMFLYRIREREKVLSDLANIHVQYQASDSKHLAYLPFIILLIISISVGLTLSFIADPFVGAVLGSIMLVLSLFFLIFFKSSGKVKPNELSRDKVSAIANEIDALKSAKQRYLQNMGFQNEDDYFATKALVRALLFQKENDLAKIHEKFEGKELSDYKYLYSEKNKKIVDLQIEIDKFGPIISPEEYIRKKRELDMLKLEKSATITNYSVEDNSKQIEELKRELDTLLTSNNGNLVNNPLDVYLRILREYFEDENIQANNEYVLDNKQINSYEEKVEMLIIQRYAYLMSNFPDSNLPIYLEDPFAGVENKNIINKIINFCSKNKQVILISEHDNYKDLGLKVLNLSSN
ncbi:MAG: hypothetical protein WCJ19_00055 [bacterium]